MDLEKRFRRCELVLLEKVLKLFEGSLSSGFSMKMLDRQKKHRQDP